MAVATDPRLEEIQKIVHEGVKRLTDAGFEISKSYRGGGWVTPPRLAFNPAPIFLPSGISFEERTQPDQPTWVQREPGA